MVLDAGEEKNGLGQRLAGVDEIPLAQQKLLRSKYGFQTMRGLDCRPLRGVFTIWLCRCGGRCSLAARALLALARAAVASTTANLRFRLRNQGRLLRCARRTCADKNEWCVREQRGSRRRQHHNDTENSPQTPHFNSLLRHYQPRPRGRQVRNRKFGRFQH